MAAIAKNVLIGIFVIFAIFLVIFILLFLHPTVGDSAKTLRIRFTDIDKVNVGTRVTYAGRPVGEVVAIYELPEAREGRLAQDGEIYVYELMLKVDSSVNVYNSDEISVRTSGLLGEKNIEINPQPVRPGEQLVLVNDQVLYATQTESVEQALKQISVVAKKFEEVLNNVNETLVEFKQKEVVANVSQAVKNVAQITEALNEPEKWGQTLTNLWLLSTRAQDTWSTLDKAADNFYHLTDRAHQSWTTVDTTLSNFQILSESTNKSWKTVDSALHNFHELSTRANHSWTTIDHSFNNFYALTDKANQSWTNVDASLHEFRQAGVNTREFTNEIKQLVHQVSQGEGSLGGILVKDDLYLQLKSAFSKANTIFNDVNQFGMLFHLNKNWQRLNARRLNLLTRLSSPDEFNRYFYDELNQISSSLSRVSMVLDESGNYPCGLMDNPEYTQRFGDLIRKVEEIEESLKMYNQQVVDQCK
jgi:phospholipid/cholesterol/gamma-HCH transport system substrate-binding protein